MLTMLLVLGVQTNAFAMTFEETPYFNDLVKAGKIDPVAKRLPQQPRVIDLETLGREPGVHGGKMRMLMGSKKDVRMMVYYGYSRLVGYDLNYKLQADILASYEVEDGRIFTLHLRPGHRWSDGAPFTTEDFRFTYEDVMLNKKLRRGGLPNSMLVNGKGPKFTVIDEVTVRYEWDDPNPKFLPALAAPLPLYLTYPSAYMKQFHADHIGEEKAEALAKKRKYKHWRAMFIRLGRQNRPENPDLPTLEPWFNTIAPPSEQFVFKRNPYFHRVDSNGRQLPYIDTVEMNISSPNLIPAKTGAGESDLQGRYISFEDYTFLKQSEKRQGYNVLLWKSAVGSKVAIRPNLNFKDDTWRAVMQDARFRQALSLGIDRHEINMVTFFGLGKEVADSPLTQSPLFNPEFANAWASHDPVLANRLLDQVGLEKRDEDGTRLLPDGKRAELIIETAGESTVETDVLQLITDHWQALGLKVFTRATQRDIFRSRLKAGNTMMSVWSGLDNAIPQPSMSPEELAPSNDAQTQWPQWGLYGMTGGKSGIEPDLASAKRLLSLWQEWQQSRDDETRERIWNDMLKLYTSEVFSIGTVNSTLQPIVVSKKLNNVPKEEVYSFQPGSYFGVFMVDTFWFQDGLGSD
ncbi:MAG: ABC transporter substrate-binding protein [Anderseniella sp.]|nr:ABC transporter substrate-binding protein [Anderseniella sp.]